MNYAELIAEAEEWHKGAWPVTINQGIQANYNACGEAEELIKRLAAALRELAPPEGWRVTEYRNSEKKVFEASGKYWIAANRGVSPVVRDYWERTNLPTIVKFPTASAAMAALDGEKK